MSCHSYTIPEVKVCTKSWSIHEVGEAAGKILKPKNYWLPITAKMNRDNTGRSLSNSLDQHTVPRPLPTYKARCSPRRMSLRRFAIHDMKNPTSLAMADGMPSSCTQTGSEPPASLAVAIIQSTYSPSFSSVYSVTRSTLQYRLNIRSARVSDLDWERGTATGNERRSGRGGCVGLPCDRFFATNPLLFL